MNSIKLYADNICVAEVLQEYELSMNMIRELYGVDPVMPGRFRDIPVQTNCPNCGAPITSHKCEYCGTVFDQDKEEQILQHEKDELLQKQFALAQAHQAESILANLQTSVLVPSYMSIRQTCQADQDVINRMQNQNLSASTNLYPYCITQPIMTKETWIEKFGRVVKNFGAGLW